MQKAFAVIENIILAGFRNQNKWLPSTLIKCSLLIYKNFGVYV